MSDDDLPANLGRNVKQLRDARGFTQHQMAKLSGLPRATWANLESGAANPTPAGLRKGGAALQVSIEELVSPPRATGKLYKKEQLMTRTRGDVTVHKLLPDRIPGVE